MKSFGEILNSLKPSFEPQERTLSDIGVILSKAYTVYKHPKFEQFSPFTPGNSSDGVSRTIVERLIWDIQRTTIKNAGTFILASEGIERVIADVQTLNVYSINPDPHSRLEELINSAHMDAGLKYLVYMARHGLSMAHQRNIQEKLKELDGKKEKMNYLHNLLISIQQSEQDWDEVLFQSMSKYLELEISKWEKYQEDNGKIGFQNEEQFYNFIIELIQNKLTHNVKYLEGYRVFWRDEECENSPKKENEIHFYLKSVLKPYCDDRGIKIVRENVVANGRIDMMFTYLDHSICMEVKKADHRDVLLGLNNQLTEYMIGEEAKYGIYLVLWYKSVNAYNKPSRYSSLEELISQIKVDRDDLQYSILGIDCSKPTSPSKYRQ